ncbi:MAG: SIS domain-containing protein, partial [Planctomycetaceae bacterium]|nr:SIS domain-containing protein [Planctomycetaceae bacterium]
MSSQIDFGYLETTLEVLRRIEKEQQQNIEKAGALMADAIAADRLIHIYGGGGHTTLVMGEMFFRAGGLANINPIMETGLSVFNQALKYLELERCVNYGRSIV